MYDVTITLDESHGELVQSESISAVANRSINTFEVLDYDNNSNGDYALIYKDIAITHNQSVSIERQNTPYNGDVYVQLYYNNGELPLSATELHNVSQNTESSGTRTVTYKLHYKIKGENTDEDKIFSIDLAILTVNSNGINQSANGQRIYGVSIQASEKFIVYSYDLDSCIYDGTPLGYGDGFNYDSPMNIEDWNYNGLGTLIWERSKRVIGLININDGVGSAIGYHTQEEYEVLEMAQYSVGVT